jgi:hypothetical protein
VRYPDKTSFVGTLKIWCSFLAPIFYGRAALLPEKFYKYFLCAIPTKLRLSGKLHSKIGVRHDSTKLLDAKRTVLVDLDEE